MEYKQQDLINMVAEESGYYKSAVKEIYNTTFNVITRIIAESKFDDLNTIKLFQGINIGAKFQKARERTKPITGEKIMTEDHIYPCAKFTQAYQFKIRDMNKEINRAGE